MSFAGSLGALAKPFCLPSALPRELRGIAAAGGFLFSHPEREAGESPRDVGEHTCSGVRRRAAFGGLSACAGVSEGWGDAAILFV